MKLPILFVLSIVNLLSTSAFAQGTLFTYQGRLNQGSSVANGFYDIRFILYNSDLGGNQQGPILTNTATMTSNGLFTVNLDFGSVFDGTPRWVEIHVRTNGSGSFTPLTPRQPLTPSPYAITAGNISPAGIAGSYTNAVSFNNAADNFSGNFNGNGSGLSNVSAATLGGLSASNFWKTTGNGGTAAGLNFLGTTDNQPLEVRVAGQRTLRLEPILLAAVTNPNLPGVTFYYSNAPNIIGGSLANAISPGSVGSVTAGGVQAVYYNTGTVNYLYGNFPNQISANISVISGGYANSIQSNSDGSMIGGGGNNVITNSTGAGICSGSGNTIQGNSLESAVASGAGNSIQNNSYEAVIAGGSQNTLQASGLSFIGAGGNNIVTNSPRGAIVDGDYNRVVTAPGGFIGGGQDNLIQGPALTGDNLESAICGGYANAIIGGFRSFIGAGDLNTNGGVWSMIGAGEYNQIAFNTYAATIAGGYSNSVAGDYSFAAGQRAKALNRGSFVWADSQNADFGSAANNQFLIRAGGGTGIGTSETPLGGLRVHSGGLAVTGQSSPNYGTAQGVFLEGSSSFGEIYGFDYSAFQPKPLVLNGPGGNVGIGTITPAFQLTLSTDSAGKPNGGTWAATSDARLKKNVETLHGALDKLIQLRGVSFEWINPADHANQGGRQAGFIAQEVKRVFPHWVQKVPAGEHDAALTPDGQVESLSLPFEFNALTVEAFRELRAEKNADLERLNRDLEKELAAKDARIDALEKAVAELKASMARVTQPVINPAGRTVAETGSTGGEDVSRSDTGRSSR